MEDVLISSLLKAGVEILPNYLPKIREFLKRPISKEEFEKEIRPGLLIKDGSTVTNEGIMNIFTNSGVEIQNSTFINRGETTIISNDGPATLNITSKKKKPKAGDVIGSISFTNKGTIIDSSDDD